MGDLVPHIVSALLCQNASIINYCPDRTQLFEVGVKDVDGLTNAANEGLRVSSKTNGSSRQRVMCDPGLLISFLTSTIGGLG